MEKLFIIISTLFIASNSLIAQFDTLISKAVYEYQNEYSDNIFGKSGQAHLYFNQTKSYYKSVTIPKEDIIKEVGMNISITHGDKYGFPILIDLSTKIKSSRIPLTEQKVVVKGKLIIPDWQIITDSTKMINEYLCIYAKCTKNGEKYEAWFTPDIPISFGPEYLFGLPGLVLEANSINTNKHFILKSISFNLPLEEDLMIMATDDDLVFEDDCAYLEKIIEIRELENMALISSGEEPINWQELDEIMENTDLLNFTKNCKQK